MCFSDIDLSLKYIYIYHLNIDKIMEMMRFTIMYKCKQYIRITFLIIIPLLVWVHIYLFQAFLNRQKTIICNDCDYLLKIFLLHFDF